MAADDYTEAFPKSGVVYGAGDFGQRLRAGLESAGTSVEGFIDPKRSPSDYGLDAISLEVTVERNLEVFIGICNPAVDIDALSKFLVKSGVRRVWNPVQISQELFGRGQIIDNYWLSGDLNTYNSQVDEIAESRSLLCDSKSLNVFDSILEYRRDGQLSSLLKPDELENQYLPMDLPFITSGMRFVDVGAYDGDTLRSMNAANIIPAATICFEPDPENFELLCSEVVRLGLPDTACYPLALGDQLAMLSFNASAGSSAGFAASGSAHVQCCPLDLMIPDWSPTHIKMDIEGAEPQAIRGMQRTIQMNRPALAISVYHAPEHHWSILRTIAEMKLDYDFYMRTYAQQTFENVLYCVPR